tara:strand:- start:226 stop:471 length:246 start_codon:yes stop_codon:yes gene_type:complete
MKKDKNLHKILLVDWYEAIDFLPIGYKLKDYIRTKDISEKCAKLLGITDREVYLAKEEVFMRKEQDPLRVEYDKMTWAIAW